ncbi:leucine rich repeat (LRR) protein [Roseimicrobium gellanilyticum]|uniref:Leucine rich repeat (LRR) protein n=1 Tax=Roseimicrobium gellanilyticum TaxID=748857 RepID=A0A366HIG0_9BACT|nr:c-type cytochrome domain-containing protein [Roseimicrobium gellanilyticum]RBP41389.1 leucine rich repeat (LRR) protein [Roseimicrobium gellanilyticum]
MPTASAALSSSDDASEQPLAAPVPAPRISLLGWASAVGIIMLFALGLYMYPPLANAGREVQTPTWALFFGRFHPIAVHVPVGVLFLAALMDVLAIRRSPLGDALKPAITFIMGVGAFGAVVAVILGVVLSREGGYDSATFQAHQTLGLATAVLAILSFVFKLITDASGRIPIMHRFFMVSTLGVMSVGAHLGGNMVHGPDYLLDHAPTAVQTNVEKAEEKLLSFFGPLRKDIPGAENHAPEPGSENPQPAAANIDPADPTVYASLVAPLMETYCYSCHGADKDKGALRLHTHELMLKGGDSGYNLVPGQPDKSLMISTMLLPLDDEDDMHMPPGNKPQPKKEEIALLSWWVKEGASKELKLSEAKAKVPAELQETMQTLLSKSKSGSGGSMPPAFLVMAEAAAQVDPAVAEAMKKINGSGASLAPVAADAKQLRFTALNVAKDYADANLKELEPIAASIVALDLARTKVTDAACDTIVKMTNLKELHLENTAVTDAGVEKLKGLANLEYLNLYGTKVTDKVFGSLEGLGKLKSVYLWQTGVTRPAAEAYKAKHAGMLVNTGWTDADNAKAVAAVAPAPVVAPAPAAPAAPAKPAAAPAPAPTPAPKPAPAPAAAAAATKVEGTALPKAGDANAKVFADVVLPILEAKCVSCHGADKSKGKLKLHTFADALKGGSDGETTVIGGNVKDSLLLVRSKLPVDDDDHMPPSDEPQLTKAELALLEWWIAEGAKEDLTVVAAKKTPEIESFLKGLASSKPATNAVAKKEEKPKAKPLTDAEKKSVAEVTAKMTALNTTLMPLALDTEQLRFGCVNAADKFGDKELAELAPAAPHIAWLDLGRSKVTDASLSTIAKMTALQRLHLEKTAVTDAGLAQLAGLQNLEYLNLYDTKVTDAGIAKLAANKSLKKLFVWGTPVTKDGAKKLEAAVPGLQVNVGLSAEEIVKLVEAAKPPPPPAPAPAPAPAPKKEEKKEEKKPEPPKPANAPAGPAKPENKPATPSPAPTPAPAPVAPPKPADAPPAAAPAPAPGANKK